jgi:hypothetical protein
MPFLPDLDKRIEMLTLSILPICNNYGLLDISPPHQRHTKANIIATFACCCAPENASPEGTLLAARLTAIFFFLDDVPKPELHMYVQQMRDVLRNPSISHSFRPQVCAFVDYLRDISTFGDNTQFRHQFEAFLLALLEEAELLDRGPITLETYKDIRHRIIFVEEYIWTWFLSERINPEMTILEQTGQLRRLASEVVYLVNDIGSIDRERNSGGKDPNLVLLLEREYGLEEGVATNTVVKLHNKTAAAYRAERTRLLEACGRAVMRPIVEVIDGVVFGNLETTKRLTTSRYEKSCNALELLKV